ncbi:MAG TPA: hypothetical protein VLO30_05680 [Chthoniobacterales bacterium]|nr:hypothetical protein [Chthoniobacterales bacterium]
MTASRQKFLAAVVVLLFFGTLLWHGVEKPALPMDEGFLLVYPELILKGQTPYRDFESFYGPANPYFLSGAYMLLGPSVPVERTVGLLYRLLILAAVFALAQRWGTIITVGCATITGFLLVPTGIVAYAWMGGVALGLWSLWLSAKIEVPWRCWMGGVCAGLALLYRLDLGPAILASALPLFLMMERRSKWKWLLGMVTGLLPLGGLLWVAGSKALLDNLFLFPVIYSGVGRRLPLLSAEPYVIYLFFAHVVASVVNVTAGAWAVRRSPRELQARLLLGWAIFGVGLTHQAIQRIDDLHVLYAAFVSIGLLPLSIHLFTGAEARGVNRSKTSLASVAVFAALAALVPELAGGFRGELVTLFAANSNEAFVLKHGDRSFRLSSIGPARAAAALLRELETLSSAGQRLFIGPADLRRTNYNDTYLYHMLPKLRPATYFLEMNPWSANRPGSRLARDVGSADWLILNRQWDGWNEPNRSREFGSDAPNVVVREQFALQGEYGGFLLFRKK